MILSDITPVRQVATLTENDFISTMSLMPSGGFSQTYIRISDLIILLTGVGVGQIIRGNTDPTDPPSNPNASAIHINEAENGRIRIWSVTTQAWI
jgi:hypothetical protein